jgi:hypothetical protein
MFEDGPTREIANCQDIFKHIEGLSYADCPDYQLIQDHIVDIYNRYEMTPVTTNDKQTALFMNSLGAT